MKREKVGYKLMIGLGIMIIALAFANYRRRQATTTKQNELLEWPKFVSKDISGRFIRASDFAKHVRYVQIVSFLDDNNIELLKRIYTD